MERLSVNPGNYDRLEKFDILGYPRIFFFLSISELRRDNIHDQSDPSQSVQA